MELGRVIGEALVEAGNPWELVNAVGGTTMRCQRWLLQFLHLKEVTESPFGRFVEGARDLEERFSAAVGR